MNRERLETKLFIPRNVDDEPNTEEIAKIRELESEFLNNPIYREAFIGIAPYGSIVGGYSNEESDIDLFVLYDNKKLDKAASADGRDLIENKKFEKVSVVSYAINPEDVIHGIKIWLDNGEEGGCLETGAMAVMSMMVTGQKINGIREKIASEIKQFSPSDQERVEKAIMESLLRKEKAAYKRWLRLPELTADERLEIFEERKNMWQDRVKKIWGFEDEK